eukprot:gnl/TRDRNA2_/TRDRNA2_129229_c0_seq4.p1 gnl/TRDRNA2_/TRDRNA2_129229_c0~~gnl/TRDRNA2_/TRDRNA2_129229_c0_seq4.p1  ORF type:complete len:462 (+),score=85.77 gnl/TRDRNA2_/TRDRNA2_129229_c0_seq4:132-1517(+)
MEQPAAEQARLAALERENQALRDQVRDLQHLIQVKDGEIALQCHLLHSKEAENAQISIEREQRRLSDKAVATQQPAGAACSSDAISREKLLRCYSSLQHSGSLTQPTELGSLTSQERDDADVLRPTPRSSGSEDHGPPTPSSQKAPKTPSKAPTAGGMASPTPDVPHAEDLAPVHTPNKRMAIVNPNTGKHIEVSPTEERSRQKPTLISLEAIAEGRSAMPQGPTSPNGGDSSTPLTLPPVVAGAPPLSSITPMRTPPPAYPGGTAPAAPYPGGMPAAGASATPGMPPPLSLGPLLGSLGLSPMYSPSHPMPPVGTLGGAGWPAAPGAPLPHCPPPPAHPAPVPGAIGLTAGTSEAAPGSAAVTAGISADFSLADHLACDHFAGGPVQLARGPLAGGPGAADRLIEPHCAAETRSPLLGTTPMQPMWMPPSQPLPDPGALAASSPPPAAPPPPPPVAASGT